jgi:hypothetical protein
VAAALLQGKGAVKLILADNARIAQHIAEAHFLARHFSGRRFGQVIHGRAPLHGPFQISNPASPYQRTIGV